MKHLLKTLILLSFFLSSCNDEPSLDEALNNTLNTKSTTKSTLANVDLDDQIYLLYKNNIPINITLFGESNSFMAARKSSGQVQLDGQDVGTGRERWYIKRDYRGYYLQVVSGYHKGWRNLYMGNPNEPTVAFLTGDNNLSLSNFYFNADFEHVPNSDRFLIRLGKGYSNRSDVYLTAVGSKIHFKNKGIDRQQWVITPIGDYEIIDINYKISVNDNVTFNPIIVKSITYNNDYDTPLDRTFTFVEKLSEISEFSETEGISIAKKTTVNFDLKMPIFANGKMTTETVKTNSWSYTTGKKETKERTFTESFTQRINPHSSLTAEFVATEYNADITYILTLRSLSDPSKIIYSHGKWKGNLIQDTKINIYDSQRNLLKSSK